MSTYSRLALIRRWAVNRINTAFVVEVLLSYRVAHCHVAGQPRSRISPLFAFYSKTGGGESLGTRLDVVFTNAKLLFFSIKGLYPYSY